MHFAAVTSGPTVILTPGRSLSRGVGGAHVDRHVTRRSITFHCGWPENRPGLFSFTPKCLRFATSLEFLWHFCRTPTQRWCHNWRAPDPIEAGCRTGPSQGYICKSRRSFHAALRNDRTGREPTSSKKYRVDFIFWSIRNKGRILLGVFNRVFRLYYRLPSRSTSMRKHYCSSLE